MICSKCIHPASQGCRVRNTPTFYHTDIFSPCDPQPVKNHHCSATYHSTVFQYPSHQHSPVQNGIKNETTVQRKWNTNVKHTSTQSMNDKKKCGHVIKLHNNRQLDTEKQNILKVLNHSNYVDVSKARKQIEMSSNLLMNLPTQQYQKPIQISPKIEIPQTEHPQTHQKRPSSVTSKPTYHCCHFQYKNSIKNEFSRNKPVYACIKKTRY